METLKKKAGRTGGNRSASDGSGNPMETRNDSGQHAAVATARRYITGGALDVVMVAACPFCGRAHRHLTADPAPILTRHPRCRQHRRYTVRVVETAPCTVEPAIVDDQLNLDGVA